MRLSSPCWAVYNVDWSCLKLLFYFSFCDCVVGTALEACEPPPALQWFQWQSLRKLNISAQNLCHTFCSLSPVALWKLFHSAQELIAKVVVGRRPQQLSCKLCNPWTTLVAGALCSRQSIVSRMAHFLRDCTHARPRAHCGLLNCWVCFLWAFSWFCLRHSLTELFSYNSVWAFHLWSTGCALSQVTSAQPLCLLCIFL